ncbi:uncharacterized protein LOC108908426 isoform X1 [Anoplophora glabripennis]|uniref:uncharacterized protein LOC108908426 isoform X1 n=1 Tax=Anoplophora glabripennis TaxID=217634 RepID=UPI0008746190|nr:uncharacterized protein LOC108908426 isoform X1 [Anoplophora glabripennis]
MDFNIDVRKKQLQSLDQYITSSKDKVQSILDYLGWNTKKNVENEPEVMCSVNPGHIVALKNSDVHLKKCFVKTSGYQSDEEFLSEPINDPHMSIKLDHTKKIEILSKARQNNQRFKADIYFISTDMSLLKIISSCNIIISLLNILFRISFLLDLRNACSLREVARVSFLKYYAFVNYSWKILTKKNKEMVVVEKWKSMYLELIFLQHGIFFDPAWKICIYQEIILSKYSIHLAWNGQDSDPMTSDRLFTTFSADERLVLYDYCVQNTEHPPIPSEFNIQIQDKKEEKFLTQEELLAKERDAKRRRIKYKSVHTSRSKKYTEVIKEVIDNQMEQYKDYLASKMEVTSSQTSPSANQVKEQDSYHTSTDIDILTKENMNDIERPSSSISHYSNHSGSSRSKKEYKYEKLYKNHNHDSDCRRNYKEYDKKHDYSNKYDHGSYKENRRHKDFEDDYRHSRDKRGWYKSERRH